MKKIMAISLMLVIVSGLGSVGCAGPAPEVQYITFPDENLEECIRQALGKSADEEITDIDLAELITLRGEMKNITDLSGLEYCINLTGLMLTNNQISDITPLQNLTNLSALHLLKNKINDITPVENLTVLGELSLGDNQITDISPLKRMTRLVGLHLGGNQISDISPLEHLTNLSGLHLGGNQISDISPLEHLTNLTGLHLDGNRISDISPLVENSGLGMGDIVWLEKNNLDLEEGSDDRENIKILEDRGVNVTYD